MPPPPSPPPLTPGGAYKTVVQIAFVIDSTVATFSVGPQEIFRTRLAKFIGGGIRAEDISLAITAGSVQILAAVVVADKSAANRAQLRILGAGTSGLTAALGVVVSTMPSFLVVSLPFTAPPQPPALPPTLPPPSWSPDAENLRGGDAESMAVGSDGSDSFLTTLIAILSGVAVLLCFFCCASVVYCYRTYLDLREQKSSTRWRTAQTRLSDEEAESQPPEDTATREFPSEDAAIPPPPPSTERSHYARMPKHKPKPPKSPPPSTRLLAMARVQEPDDNQGGEPLTVEVDLRDQTETSIATPPEMSTPLPASKRSLEKVAGEATDHGGSGMLTIQMKREWLSALTPEELVVLQKLASLEADVPRPVPSAKRSEAVRELHFEGKKASPQAASIPTSSAATASPRDKRDGMSSLQCEDASDVVAEATSVVGVALAEWLATPTPAPRAGAGCGDMAPLYSTRSGTERILSTVPHADLRAIAELPPPPVPLPHRAGSSASTQDEDEAGRAGTSDAVLGVVSSQGSIEHLLVPSRSPSRPSEQLSRQRREMASRRALIPVYDVASPGTALAPDAPSKSTASMGGDEPSTSTLGSSSGIERAEHNMRV